MKDPKQLARLLTNNIMLFHDTENYVRLEKNSIELVKEMGYPVGIAKKVAEKIKDIYVLYDKAQLDYKRHSKEKEMKNYENAKKHAREINNLLNDGYDCQILVDIVIQWRHKNKVASILQIFKCWKNKLPLISAIKCTYYQVQAGRCHDDRNKACFENFFLKIYKELLLYNVLPILF